MAQGATQDERTPQHVIATSVARKQSPLSSEGETASAHTAGLAVTVSWVSLVGRVQARPLTCARTSGRKTPRGFRSRQMPRQILNAPASGPVLASLANRPIGAAGFLGNLLIAPLRVVESHQLLELGSTRYSPPSPDSTRELLYAKLGANL